jgi:PQQ-dependent catabolism-associated beta-propeller protein
MDMQSILQRAAVGTETRLWDHLLRIANARRAGLSLGLAMILLASAVASAQPSVYVTNERSGDVSVIDTLANRVISTIEVGKRPRGIRARSDGKVLYVALSGSPIAPPGSDKRKLPTDKSADGIGVIDLATGKLREKIDSGSDPESFSISEDERFLYVSNEDEAAASIVDIAARKIVAKLKVATEPEGVATSPDGKWVYVTCEGTNQVFVIDIAKREVITNFKTGARPRQIAFVPGGNKAFVTCENGSCVTVVDVARHAPVKDIRPAGEKIRPMGICISPDGRRAYVTTGRSKSLLVIDAVNNEILSTLADVGERPWGIGITPDGKTLYTANGPSNDVSVIDVASMTITMKVPVGASPWGIAIAEAPEE